MTCPRCGSPCLPYYSDVPSFTPWRPVFISQTHLVACSCGARWPYTIVLGPEPLPDDGETVEAVEAWLETRR